MSRFFRVYNASVAIVVLILAAFILGSGLSAGDDCCGKNTNYRSAVQAARDYIAKGDCGAADRALAKVQRDVGE